MLYTLWPHSTRGLTSLNLYYVATHGNCCYVAIYAGRKRVLDTRTELVAVLGQFGLSQEWSIAADSCGRALGCLYCNVRNIRKRINTNT